MNALLKKIILPSYYALLRTARSAKILYQPTVKICIGSNRKYASQTIPPLVASLVESGIRPNDIYVFEGGYHEKQYAFTSFHHYFVAHNSIDFTALIEAADSDVKTDYWFFLHDTCLVGKKYSRLIANIPHFLPDAMPLKNYPSMSMGAYKASYLKGKKEQLDSYRNKSNDEVRLRQFKENAIRNEDILFKESKSPIVYNGWMLDPDEEHERTNIEIPSIYSNRICEYFPQADLYKFKANYKPEQPRILEL
jgi:hypothetical protein